MTCIKIKDTEGDFCMEVMGHAGYGEKGKDIVCAGVSTLVFTFIKMLEKNEKDIEGYEYKSGDGIMKISFSYVNRERLKHVISTIICGFSMMSESYPDNVSLSLTK